MRDISGELSPVLEELTCCYDLLGHEGDPQLLDRIRDRCPGFIELQEEYVRPLVNISKQLLHWFEPVNLEPYLGFVWGHFGDLRPWDKAVQDIFSNSEHPILERDDLWNETIYWYVDDCRRTQCPFYQPNVASVSNIDLNNVLTSFWGEPGPPPFVRSNFDLTQGIETIEDYDNWVFLVYLSNPLLNRDFAAFLEEKGVSIDGRRYRKRLLDLVLISYQFFDLVRQIILARILLSTQSDRSSNTPYYQPVDNSSWSRGFINVLASENLFRNVLQGLLGPFQPFSSMIE